MDTFIEQLIKRKKNTKDYIIETLICIAGTILVLLCLTIFRPYLGMLIILVPCGIIYGAYKLIRMRYIEFEYSFTNGDLTIDKIIERQRRKRVISFDVKDAEEMGKYDKQAAARLENKSVRSRYITGINENGISENSWYIICDTKKDGVVLVVFDPEEKVLDAIKAYIPRQVRVEAFGR